MYYELKRIFKSTFFNVCAYFQHISIVLSSNLCIILNLYIQFLSQHSPDLENLSTSGYIVCISNVDGAEGVSPGDSK